MKKIFSSLLILSLFMTIGFSQDFKISDAIAPKEAHSEFANTYRTKIEAKAKQKGIPFGIVAAIMSSQSGAKTKIANNNFAQISSNSKYARVGKFAYTEQENGLMIFTRARHNAEATVLILSGWLKNRLGTQPETDLEWLNALTEANSGLFPIDRLPELATAYEGATGALLDMNQLNFDSEFLLDENEKPAISVIQTQELAEVNNNLALTKEELAQKKQRLLLAEQQKAVMEEELMMTKEELALAEAETDSARQKVVNLRNEFQSHKSNPNPLFKSMIDIKGGIGFFKSAGTRDLSNGYNVEAQYSLINNKGIGLEAGVNMMQMTDSDKFEPYINPYLGFSIGKYDNTLGFSFSPRAYYFMNPMLEFETSVEDAIMVGRVKSTFMYGAGANVKLRLSDFAAFTLYANYMRGPFKVEEKGILDGTPYQNTTKTNLNVFGSGIGLSFSL